VAQTRPPLSRFALHFARLNGYLDSSFINRMLLPVHKKEAKSLTTRAKAHHRGLDMPQRPQGARRVVRCGRGRLFGGLHGVETRQDTHPHFSDLAESLRPALKNFVFFAK